MVVEELELPQLLVVVGPSHLVELFQVVVVEVELELPQLLMVAGLLQVVVVELRGVVVAA